MISGPRTVGAAALLLLASLAASVPPGPMAVVPAGAPVPFGVSPALANFSGAMQRLVDLVAAGGGALLALVWARVAISWFSNDISKKVQAKDRARDALVGSLIFVAALSGLIWSLAEWVLTGR